MRILFVDDEPRILTGIENALLFADDWESDFANSGEDAIGLMATNRYDVLVTDMKMPGLTGADVLEHAKASNPETIRVILSGEVDQALADRAMPLAHEFVSKPCDPDDLLAIIDRIYGASQGLEKTHVRDILGSLDRLPSQPNLHLGIQEALERGEGADVVARLVEADLAIASSVIKTANSAFYGFATPAETVQAAVVRLGMQTTTGIVLNAEIASWAGPETEELVASLNARSTMTSDIVRKLVGGQVAQAALAGLLHNIGLLVLITQFPSEYEQYLEAVSELDDHDEAIELELFGATHAEIGACMLEMWNADPLVIEATRHHHNGSTSVSPDARLIIDAIAAADFACSGDKEPPSNLDPQLVARATDLANEANRRIEER